MGVGGKAFVVKSLYLNLPEGHLSFSQPLYSPHSFGTNPGCIPSGALAFPSCLEYGHLEGKLGPGTPIPSSQQYPSGV